jgi:type I restriction enzyme S subunit
LPIGTILFTSRATIGDAGFAMQECCTNQGFQSFVVKDRYNKEFIYYWICNNKNEFISKANGSTFLEISKNQITQIPLPLPTLSEQNKIAEFLTDIDTKIEKLTRKKELTEQYKKGAMQKIFSQKIRFKDENRKNYSDWEEKRLGDVAEIVMGQSPSSTSYSENSDELPLIQGNADIKNRVTFPRIYTSEPTKLCHTGDILMTVRAPVGTIAKSLHNACIGRGVCVIRAKNKINSDFLYQFLITYEPQWKNLE